MQPLQPEQATFLLNTIYLPSLKNEHRITKSIIDAIPSDKCDYRHDNICKSALELAWHIASAEMMFMDAVANGAFDFSSMGRPNSVKNSTEVADWYEKNFHQRFDRLGTLTNEQLTKILDFRGVAQLPAVMYLNFALNHSIHHRGQLSTYLRPMGAKVPIIYGESYDSAQARKGAQQASTI